MRAFRTLTTALLLTLGPACPSNADTVTLRSGAKVDGTIVKSDSNNVTITDIKSNFRTFAREDMANVETNAAGQKPAVPVQPVPPSKPSTPPPAKVDEAAPTPAPTLTEVIATGVGSTADSARKDALRQAVSQVVGSLVVASDAVANDELIDSKILTYSDGYVERFEPIGEPQSKDGLVRIKIRAWVRQGKLTKALADNRVPVKDVDVRSMQGQSETIADQQRSAADVVVAVFQGFPNNVLVAEPLTPRRISGDEQQTIFEVPVRIKVDMKKWADWVAEAKRLLDPIAEASGTEAWNTKMAGWYPLSGTAAPKKTGTNPSEGTRADPTASPQERVAQMVRSSVWLNRLVPREDRSGCAVSIKKSYESSQLPTLNAGNDHKRVVAVLDKLGGKVNWWQLPPDPWESLLGLKIAAEINVRISDATGESVATHLDGWKEVIEATKPTEISRTLFEASDNVGGRFLTVGRTDSDRGFISYDCRVAMDRNGSLVGSYLFPQAIHLFIPCAYGWPEDGPTVRNSDGPPVAMGESTPFFAPTIVLPYRFVIPGEVASVGTGLKIEAELVER
jgi:hypothetical protein